MIEGLFRNAYGSSGLPCRIPDVLQGATNLGFCSHRRTIAAGSCSPPWVVCFSTWAIIEKTSLGATLRAATENAPLVQAHVFGVNVPRLITLTYGAGVALAAFAGVLAAPIYSVNPNMGSNFINTVFAVVVIGGMGSILGSIITGFGLGVIEGLTKVFYPQLPPPRWPFLVMTTIVLLAVPSAQACSEEGRLNVQHSANLRDRKPDQGRSDGRGIARKRLLPEPRRLRIFHWRPDFSWRRSVRCRRPKTEHPGAGSWA